MNKVKLNHDERYLTGFRGLFCLLIVIFHYSDPLNIHLNPISQDFQFFRKSLFLTNASLLVYFFYFLSGFILTKKYWIEQANNQNYLRKRIFRIFPLHLTLLLFYSVRSILYHQNDTRFSFTELPLNLGLVQNWFPGHFSGWNYPTWTLSSEWFLYLFFGLLIYKGHLLSLSWKKKSFLVISATSIIIEVFFFFKNTFNHDLANYDLITFSMGILLALLFHNIHFEPRKLWGHAQWAVLFLIYWLVKMQRPPLYFLPAWILLFFFFHFGQSSLKLFLSSRVMRWIGERSLTIYLIHIPLFEILGDYLKTINQYYALAIFLPCFIVFVSIFYELFEKRIYRLA